MKEVVPVESSTPDESHPCPDPVVPGETLCKWHKRLAEIVTQIVLTTSNTGMISHNP